MSSGDTRLDPPTVAALADIATRRDASALGEVRAVLAATDDDAVRDAAALALRDLADPDLPALVATLLADPRTHGRRATLVFALARSNVASIVDHLVEVALSNEFDAAAEAMLRLEACAEPIPEPVWDRCVAHVGEALAAPDLGDDPREHARHLAARFGLSRLAGRYHLRT